MALKMINGVISPILIRIFCCHFVFSSSRFLVRPREGPSVSPASRSREMRIWVASDDDNFAVSVDLDRVLKPGGFFFLCRSCKKIFYFIAESTSFKDNFESCRPRIHAICKVKDPR